MASTFDDMTDAIHASDRYQSNIRLNDWLVYTFTDYKAKYKRCLIRNWKVTLVVTCLWLSLGIPVWVLWHESKELRSQIQGKRENIVNKVLEMLEFQVSSSTKSTSLGTDTGDIDSFDTMFSSSTAFPDFDIEKLFDKKLQEISHDFSLKLDECARICSPGRKGEQGIQGPPGPAGTNGIPGSPGASIQGDKGTKGDTGPPGDHGTPGIPGLMGLVGPKGEKGSRGDSGVNGMKGEKGEPGLQGIKGDTGQTGYQGERGYPGPPGQKGSRWFGR